MIKRWKGFDSLSSHPARKDMPRTIDQEVAAGIEKAKTNEEGSCTNIKVHHPQVHPHRLRAHHQNPNPHPL